MSEGISTTGAAVENLLDWLKGELGRMNYGEIGLSFTVHGGKVTKHRKILEIVEKED